MRVDTRQMTISGVLSALTLVLGATGVGFLPLPTPAGAATVMHIPVIIAGILQGPAVGAFVGLVFGLFSLQYLGDFRVVIPARLLIGPMAYLVYHALRRRPWGIPVSAAVGSAVNTVGTLGLAVAFGYVPLQGAGGAMAIAMVQGVPEALLAAIVTPPVVLAVVHMMGNGVKRK